MRQRGHWCSPQGKRITSIKETAWADDHSEVLPTITGRFLGPHLGLIVTSTRRTQLGMRAHLLVTGRGVVARWGPLLAPDESNNTSVGRLGTLNPTAPSSRYHYMLKLMSRDVDGKGERGWRRGKLWESYGDRRSQGTSLNMPLEDLQR